MLISSIEFERLSREQTTRLLYGDCVDDRSIGDCIFVFGGGMGRDPNERVEKAVELYAARRAPLVLFAGGTKYGKHNPPEAIQLRKFAIDRGIPEADICVECESNNTKENVVASLPILERHIGLQTPRRLLLVSVPWHMRRCLLTFRTFAKSITCTWCPADYPEYRRDTWWQTAKTRERVEHEARDLIRYVREGQLLDEEVAF